MHRELLANTQSSRTQSQDSMASKSSTKLQSTGWIPGPVLSWALPLNSSFRSCLDTAPAGWHSAHTKICPGSPASQECFRAKEQDHGLSSAGCWAQRFYTSTPRLLTRVTYLFCLTAAYPLSFFPLPHLVLMWLVKENGPSTLETLCWREGARSPGWQWLHKTSQSTPALEGVREEIKGGVVLCV